MNQHLQNILDIIQQSAHLSAEEKAALSKSAKAAEKEQEITSFKLQRTEKVKHTTAILLEETIAELEQKRKAVEAQNRELEIEAALERVRSRTMAMHKSEEIADILGRMFEELKRLDMVLVRVLIWIFNPEEKYISWWSANAEVESTAKSYRVDYNEHPVFLSVLDAWQKKLPLKLYTLSGAEKVSWQDHLFNNTGLSKLPEMVQNGMRSEGTIFTTSAICDYGLLMSGSLEPLSAENIDIIQRFGRTFQQSYTRHIDVQKAEAQARESQIQLAMERVRARTMAMQRSEELGETAALLFKQIADLGTKAWSSGFDIWEEDDVSATAWMANPDGSVGMPFIVPYTEDPFFKQILEAKRSGKDFFVMESEGKELEETYHYLFNLSDAKKHFDGITRLGFQMPAFQITHCAFFSHGYLMFITYEPVPEMWDIFKRFAKVFEQTYTRFLDLQKAEAQARESQIQLAMERVRARTMAMQRSDELAEVATVLFQQVKALGVPQWTCGFSIWEIGDKEFTWYPGSPDGDILPPCKIPLTEHPVFISFDESRRRGDELFVYEKEGEFQAGHYRYMLSLPGGIGEFLQSRLDAGVTFPSFQIDHIANFSHGNLAFITYEHFPEMHDVFKRFAKVFEQTYTRFLDLQKAEAQARESQIQLALERVRARTMAMQRSDELADVAQLLFQQVKGLGIKAWTTGFNIWQEDNASYIDWITGPSGEFLEPYTVDLTSHPAFSAIREARQRGDDFFMSEWQGEQIVEGYKLLNKFGNKGQFQQILDSGIQFPTHQYNHLVFGAQVSLLFVTYEPCPEAWDIFKRFGKVFEQTYTRFLDLQKAESQAVEVVKRASVDRVRAEIASMRTTLDLEKITPLIWNELTTLGVPFIRCGVFIMDEEQQLVHTFLSTPDGKAIAAFRQPYNTPGETSQIISHWHNKKMYRQHWDEAQFIAFTKNLADQGAITSGEKYLTENRPTNLDLHFLPFLQGMLYVGNSAPLSDDELRLVQNLADAFSTAYARYEDFNRLESAKKQVENTLVDLRQAQAQLVQSEKMASLGELTAGIAHEIQNPLNFVTNFSEVNKELLNELKAEMEKGNIKEVQALANDVIQNEEKINHHGRRADAIVKGMLQHSQTTTGQKEPTDINNLADEYFRLSYHGLRAKNKSFHAGMHTEFDNTIGKINIVPQDIGRVLLNLYNNAFYAVTPHSPPAGGENNGLERNNEPTVWITTKHIDSPPAGGAGAILISVRDNGPGVPQKVLDKIFQPFFTTKPPGQGTGLGLSLAYDIIKAHGGEIKVETKEGEGSEFIIQLPFV